MAEIKSESAPGARGDKPREPGAFCVRRILPYDIRITPSGIAIRNGYAVTALVWAYAAGFAVGFLCAWATP